MLAYIVGVALGDGNLSSPNGRATRLRITCDKKYPRTAADIARALQTLFPRNKVSYVERKDQGCFDISVYSNKLDDWMPWKVGCGSKAAQDAHVPDWILRDRILIQECLRGLIQTDGCIYLDRGYQMINFVNNSRLLAENVRDMLICLEFRPRFNILPLKYGATKYTVKIARKAEVANLIAELTLHKE